jgi:hypothetical protein
MMMDIEQIFATGFCIFFFGLLGILYQGSFYNQECKLKAIEKGMPAIEIQAICK